MVLLGFSCKKEDEPQIEPPVLDPAKVEEIIELKTSFGDMYIWLYKGTPGHRENFLKLAKQDFYDGTTFHRIISNFMIHGGDPNSKDTDPNNDGTGGPGYTIPAEIKDDFKHVRGALAAARTNNPAKASSGSQFYICHSTSGTAGLNGNYTVYGMVMKGVEVVDEIVKQPKNSSDRPNSNIEMDVNVIEKTQKEIEEEYSYTDFR